MWNLLNFLLNNQIVRNKKKGKYREIRTKSQISLFFVILIVHEYLSIDCHGSGVWVEISLGIVILLKIKKNTKYKIMVFEVNSSTKNKMVPWVQKNKKRACIVTCFFIFFNFFFVFIIYIKFLEIWEKQIGLVWLSVFLLNFIGGCKVQDILKTKR